MENFLIRRRFHGFWVQRVFRTHIGLAGTGPAKQPLTVLTQPDLQLSRQYENVSHRIATCPGRTFLVLAKYWKDVLRSLVSIGRAWSVHLSGWQAGERGEKIGTASGQVSFGRLLRKSTRLLKFWDFFRR
jgi:hypothetical protein